jgi:hypothetical protein
MCSQTSFGLKYYDMFKYHDIVLELRCRLVQEHDVGSATAPARGYRGASCIRLVGRRLGTQASQDGWRDKVGTCVERGLTRVEGAIRLLRERKMRRQRVDKVGGRGMHGRDWRSHDKNEVRRGFREATRGRGWRPRLERPRLWVGS